LVLLLTGVRAVLPADGSGGLGVFVDSQLFAHGRDVTLSSAPVGVVSANLLWGSSDERTPGLMFGLRSFGALARRGAPWRASSADTLETTARLRVPLWSGSAVAEAGLRVSVFIGAIGDQGLVPGTVGIQPSFRLRATSSPLVPAFTGLVDLTPDQVGWRSGLVWTHSGEVGGLVLDGYIGAFRPHNFARQKSGSFLEEVFAGRVLEAIGTLVPSDVLLSVRGLLPLADAVRLESAASILLVTLRAQNPQQLVPAFRLGMRIGPMESVPDYRPGE
jgi:hypothetical protein